MTTSEMSDLLEALESERAVSGQATSKLQNLEARMETTEQSAIASIVRWRSITNVSARRSNQSARYETKT